MDKIVRARSFRRQPTSPERLLWAQLRDRRLGGFKFRRQRPIGPYVADFVCLERRLIVEVDGAPHELTVAHDTVRDARLKAAGYRVLRLPNDEVRGNLDGVCETILNALAAAELPSPWPSPASGRGERD
jgi:adenine-specific DNA-methyltransferase